MKKAAIILAVVSACALLVSSDAHFETYVFWRAFGIAKDAADSASNDLFWAGFLSAAAAAALALVHTIRRNRPNRAWRLVLVCFCLLFLYGTLTAYWAVLTARDIESMKEGLKKPNQAPEPTPTAVTPPARQEARQP